MKITVCCRLCLKKFASPDVSLSLAITWDRWWWWFVFHDFSSLEGGEGSNVLTNKYTAHTVTFCSAFFTYLTLIASKYFAYRLLHGKICTVISVHITWLCLKDLSVRWLWKMPTTNKTHMNVTCTTARIIVQPPYGPRATCWEPLPSDIASLCCCLPCLS